MSFAGFGTVLCRPVRYALASLLLLLAASFCACSDDDSSIEFLFNREATDVSVLRSCASKDDTSACYRIRLR